MFGVKKGNLNLQKEEGKILVIIKTYDPSICPYFSPLTAF